MARVATISKCWTFDASHQLPNHAGKCSRLHGHTYRVQVEVRGPIQGQHGGSDEGMVMDFAQISRVWKDQLEPLLDHRHLNDSVPGLELTTAENLAAWLLDAFRTNGVPATAVTVNETPTSSARVEA